MRVNRFLDCPGCSVGELQTLDTDVTDNGVGLRRVRCKDCRGVFTTVEAFFTDDTGDPDCFLQLATNVRLHDRELRYARTGKKPRRQMKGNDDVDLTVTDGRVLITYERKPQQRTVYLFCKYGHALTDDNVRINKTTGARVCMTCKRKYQAEWQRLQRRLRREQAA